MIEAKTLEKVQRICTQMGDTRSQIENLAEKELADKGWIPGHGEKPHRLREMERMMRELDKMVIDLDKLWS